jgi:tetratricopeptide (TPR) repeat protein
VNEVRQELQKGYEAQAAGDPEAALEQFGEVLELDPENLAAVAARANCFERLGRDQEALAEFETAARRSSMDPFANWRVANLLATSNDPQVRDGQRALEIALKVLEAVRRQPPRTENEVNALALLAAAQAEAGDFKAAVATQREAVQKAAEWQLPELRQRLAGYEAGKAWRRTATSN